MHSRKLLIYVLLFSLGSVLCFLLATFMLRSWYVVDTQQLDVRFTVMDHNSIGFNLNTTALTFGKVPRLGGAQRTIVLKSQFPTIAKIRFEPEELNQMMSVSTNNMLVNQEGTPVVFSLEVPENATAGNYTGTVTIIYLRKMPWN